MSFLIFAAATIVRSGLSRHDAVTKRARLRWEEQIAGSGVATHIVAELLENRFNFGRQP